MSTESRLAADTKVSLRHYAPHDLTDDTEQRWQTFLRSAAGPALFAHPAWSRILHRGLGHETIWVEASSDESTVGLLPLAFVQSPLFGRFLSSLPYLNYGGPIAERPDVATQLLDAAIELAEARDVRYLLLRHLHPVSHPKLSAPVTDKVVSWLTLPATVDEFWTGMPAKLRSQIRSGMKKGVSVDWGTGPQQLADFYRIFSRNMRDLGTPVFSRRLFAAMLDELPEAAEICVARFGGQAVAAALLLHGTGMTEVPSASSLREFNSTSANMVLYHALISRAIERGQRLFDFGRSTEGGSVLRFKSQWGASHQPTHWQYYLRTGSIDDFKPDNPRFERKKELWKRLPLAAATWLGPWISRAVP